ncbi:hypothetical protein HDU98_009438 [Podochytrium sp. JEL0797]|nr:hypothetical protein HDU98_009438 [Podochytrium sp. JEL0797]
MEISANSFLDPLFELAQKPGPPLSIPAVRKILNNREALAVNDRIDPTIDPLVLLITTPLGSAYFRAAPFRLAADACTVLSPMVIRELVSGPASLTVRLILVAALCLLQMSQTVFANAHLQRTMRVGWAVKSALLCALFEKAMEGGVDAQSAGSLVNIFETDPGRIEMALGSMHMVYSAPLLIFATAGILVNSLGLAGFVGFLTLAAFVPSQSWAMKFIMSLRKSALKLSDERLKQLHDAVSSMRIIKLCAPLGVMLSNSIEALRNSEMEIVQRYLMLRGALAGVTQIVPTFALFTTLLTWSVLHGYELPHAAVVVTAMSLLHGLRVPLILLPQVITQASDARLSYRRILAFLKPQNSPESIKKHESPIDSPIAIEITSSNFFWDQPSSLGNPTLSEIDLHIPKGSLTAIIGATGSGKSSLLSAMAGEMHLQPDSKSAITLSSIPFYYTPQPWIHSASIRTNITFSASATGRDILLEEVLAATALDKDLQSFPDGINTLITDAQATLSGGQRARLGLARAMYARSKIVLLDDPLGALDEAVAKHVFSRVIQTGMSGSTRVVALPAQRMDFLHEFDFVVVMKDGRVEQFGKVADLVGSILGDTRETGWEEVGSSESSGSGMMDGSAILVGSVESTKKPATPVGSGPEKPPIVTNATWNQYMEMAGGIPVAGQAMIVVGVTQVLRIITDVWLSNLALGKSLFGLSPFSGLFVYFLMACCQVVSIVMQGLSFSKAGSDASRKLHQQSLFGVFHSPMSFFEKTPIGRITSRFSKDLDDIDNFLPETLRITAFTVSLVLTNLLSIAFLFPNFLVALIPALWFYNSMQAYYRKGTKQIKRLEAITRTPLTSHFSSTLAGSSTLRSLPSAQTYFRSQFATLLNDHNVPCFAFFHMQRWLSIRLESVSAVLIGITALSVALAGGSGSGQGLVLAYAIQVTASLTWWVRQVSESERMMVSVERVLGYAGARSELDNGKGTSDGHDNEEAVFDGDSRVAVEFRDVSVTYENEVCGLDGVSFAVKRGGRVGIMGRTGAGKSSILSVLMRLVDHAGEVTVDGARIRDAGVDQVRSRIGVVPQDPCLFDMSMRMNLDPSGLKADSEIMPLLAILGLDTLVEEKGGLSARISKGSLSTGQTQLLCVARALLKNPSILVLDEATSSTDSDILDAILSALQSEAYRKMTVLMISHHLATVNALCGTVIVLEDGRIVGE